MVTQGKFALINCKNPCRPNQPLWHRVCTHDIPVTLIPRRLWSDYYEPELTPFDVSVYLPELKQVKNITERYKNIGNQFYLQANKQVDSYDFLFNIYLQGTTTVYQTTSQQRQPIKRQYNKATIHQKTIWQETIKRESIQKCDNSTMWQFNKGQLNFATVQQVSIKLKTIWQVSIQLSDNLTSVNYNYLQWCNVFESICIYWCMNSICFYR